MRRLMICTILASLLAMPALAHGEQPEGDTFEHYRDCWVHVVAIHEWNKQEFKKCEEKYPAGFIEDRRIYGGRSDREITNSQLQSELGQIRQEFRNHSDRSYREYNLRKSGLLP